MADIAPTDVRRLQEFVDAVWPDHHGAELIVWLPFQKRAVLPVRVYVNDSADNVPTLSEGEREIVEAFEGTPAGTVLSVADIAKRVGCENGSNLRERLGRLVRMKMLVNERPGYRLSD